MASGIKVDENCIQTYSDLKSKKEKSNRPFAISFKIDQNNTIIVVDKIYKRPTGDASQEDAFRMLVEDLPCDDGRYVAVDLCVAAAAGETKTDRIVLIVWVPDSAPVKIRMVYSSSVLNFKEKLVIKDHIQANEKCDLTYGEITTKVSKKK